MVKRVENGNGRHLAPQDAHPSAAAYGLILSPGRCCPESGHWFSRSGDVHYWVDLRRSATGPTSTLADVATLVRCGHGGPMKSETAKLPKGQSYPLRPSILESALADAGLSIDTHLIRSPGNLFDAHFWTPNENVPYERLYVRFGSVPSPDLASTRNRVETEALPSLLRWIKGILALPSNSPIRRESQRIDLSSLCR